jgi:hypothetical protein
VQKLALAILLLLVGAGTSGFWFWRQATYLPDWYTQSPPLPKADQALGQGIDQANERQTLKVKLGRTVRPVPLSAPSNRPLEGSVDRSADRTHNTHEVRLDAQTFNEFVVSSIPPTPQGDAVLPAIKAIKTEIEDQKLKVGLVINTAEIPLKKLPQKSRSQLEQTLNTFPFLKNQEIYLGLIGQPRLESKQVVLGNNAKVQVGGLTMDLADFAERVGIPAETLEQQINLQLGQLNIQDIDFAENAAVLQGTVD